MKKMHRIILSVLLLAGMLSGCRQAGSLSAPTVVTVPPTTEASRASQFQEETVVTVSPTGTAFVLETQETTQHVHQYTSTVTPPTCTTDGFTTYTCACGYSYNSNMVPAYGHSWSQWVVDKYPTTTETGLEHRTCSVCNTTEDREIDRLPDATGHVHSYTSVVTPPTCTTNGYTTYSCICGDSYTADEVPASGHSWGAWFRTKEPTATEAGEDTRTCSVCNETEKRTVTPGTSEHTHSYTETVVAPTCTTGGFTTYTCSICSYSYNSKATAALGHDWGQWDVVKAPTATEPGLKRRTCSRCLISEEQESPISGSAESCSHSYTSSVTAPTCTTGGFTTYTCTICGSHYNSNTTLPTGHSWSDWVCTVSPTTTQTGQEIRSCTICSTTDTREVPALSGDAG